MFSILKHVSKWNISEEMEEELTHIRPKETLFANYESKKI